MIRSLRVQLRRLTGCDDEVGESAITHSEFFEQLTFDLILLPGVRFGNKRKRPTVLFGVLARMRAGLRHRTSSRLHTVLPILGMLHELTAAAQGVPGARPLGRFSVCSVPPPRNFTGYLGLFHAEAA